MVATSVNAGAFAADRIAEVFGRSVSGLFGYEDFVRLIISSAALMFLPYTQLRRRHVAVDIFVSWLPNSFRAVLEKAWLIAITCAALFLAYWMVAGLIETRDDHALSRILGWPEWPFYVPGVFSLLLWAFTAFAQTVDGSARDA